MGTVFIHLTSKFAPTVLTTLPIRTASQGGSFTQDSSLTNDNTPPMPLPVRRDAHLGGLFFLGA